MGYVPRYRAKWIAVVANAGTRNNSKLEMIHQFIRCTCIHQVCPVVAKPKKNSNTSRQNKHRMNNTDAILIMPVGTGNA